CVRLESLGDVRLGLGIVLGIDMMFRKEQMGANVPGIVLERLLDRFDELFCVARSEALREAKPEIGILRDLLHRGSKGLRRESEVVLAQRKLSAREVRVPQVRRLLAGGVKKHIEHSLGISSGKQCDTAKSDALRGSRQAATEAAAELVHLAEFHLCDLSLADCTRRFVSSKAQGEIERSLGNPRREGVARLRVTSSLH